MFENKELPLVDSAKYPEPFSCRISSELRLLMHKAKQLKLDISDVARWSMEAGFQEAIKRREKELGAELPPAA